MIHLTSQQIPALQGLKFQQRMHVIKLAVNQLSVPRKLILNITKLIILVHFFSVLARFEGWVLLPYLIAAGLVYPLITNPVTYYLTRHQLTKARQALYPEQN